IVAGLTYAYSGFAAGQIVHANVFHALVWLPLELLLVEQALQADGGKRLRYAVLAGAVFGIQALAAHMQITLMSGLTVTAFVAYRVLVSSSETREDPRRHRVGSEMAAHLGRAGRRIAAAARVLAVVGVVGLAFGAVRLLPLYELRTETNRRARARMD